MESMYMENSDRWTSQPSH